MLLRVCIENLTHSVPRIMGWTKTKYEGKTHGICDDCMKVWRDKIENIRGLKRLQQHQVKYVSDLEVSD